MAALAVPGECDLTEGDFTAYLALGSALVVARFALSSTLWYVWLKRLRAQRLAGKAPTGIRALPITPLVTSFWALSLAIYVALTYTGTAKANDGTSLTLLNLTFLPSIISGLFFARKYTSAQRKMNGVQASRRTNNLIDGFAYSYIIVNLLITILCSIVKAGDPFWFKANVAMFVFLDWFFMIVLVGTVQQVKGAVRAKSLNKERASKVARALTRQQILLSVLLILGSLYWIGLGFWWTPTWPLALGNIAVEVFAQWGFFIATHRAIERKKKRQEEEAKVNNPIAPPASMFIYSHARPGTELREGQGGSQGQLVRTLVIPAKDTLLYRMMRTSLFERDGISKIFSLFIACLTITGVTVSLVSVCIDVMLPLLVAGFACLLVVHVIVVLNTLTIRVCRQLLWTSSVLYRLLFALLWLLDFCDVLEWDMRCLAPVGLFLLWSLVFMEDASIKESKRWLSPIIALLSATSSLCVVVIIKFDLLFRRVEHLLTLQSGAASVSWSTYQATGDFSVVLFVLLLMDAFHIVRRIGLSHLLHFKGTIYVCIVPLGSHRVFNPVSMRLMGPINFQEIFAEKPDHSKLKAPDNVLSESTTVTSNCSENTSPVGPELLSDPVPPLVAHVTEQPPIPDVMPAVPAQNLQMADAADAIVKDGVLMNRRAPDGSVPLNTVILREDDAVAVRVLGKELGRKWLYWAGSPWMRVLIIWANTIPVTIWVALVLPGIIPIEYSLLSILTLLVVMRNLMLKNVHMMRVIVSTRGFWLKTLLYGVSLGFFAHMLFWDVRAFTLAVMFILGVDTLLVDARCVFFVKSAKRAYEERFTALATSLYVLGNIVFTLSFVALPFVAGGGIIANARINSFIPLREEANAINGTATIYDPTNGEIVRGTVARLNLYQFVSDFLTGMCFFVVIEFATELRLSRKQKTRRIQLKSFHALVHPVFTSPFENTTVQDEGEENIPAEEVEEQRQFGSIVGPETFQEEDGNLILADGTRVYFKMS